MIIRTTARDDYGIVEELWRTYGSNYELPNLSNTVTHAVVQNEDKIIAFGMVKLFAEAVLVLDHSESRRNKVNAIKLLMLEAFRGCDQHKLSQLHCFIKDEQFARLMMKHYSFNKVLGEALVMDLRS